MQTQTLTAIENTGRMAPGRTEFMEPSATDPVGLEIVECVVSSNRLEEVMQKRGLSQEKTARRAGMSTRQLCRVIEHGVKKKDNCPSLERAYALSVVLGEPLEKLFRFRVRTRKALP